MQERHHGKHEKHRNSPDEKPRRRRGRIVLYTLFGFGYLYVSTSLWIFHGPFQYVKNYLIDTIDATRHGYLLRPLSMYTLPESVIAAHSITNQMVSETKPLSQIQGKDFSTSDGSIQLDTVPFSTFTAYVMLVKDPKRIKVVTTKYLDQHGETVPEMVKDAGAVAGINAGGFNDQNQQGTGAFPLGITMHNGKVIRNTGSWSQPQPIIAFTKGGQMIAGAYSLPQLEQFGVQEAVGFGPVLVQDGKPVPTENKGWDIRTAIGQASDGTVILVVTTGRGKGGEGATFDDLKYLMLKYHATIAANLDGGSSSTMVYNGKLVNTPWDWTGARNVATSIVVMPESGGGHNG